MQRSAAGPGVEGAFLGTAEGTAVARDIARYWWVWLVTGVAWLLASVVVLQFDRASITTIGVLTGCMLIFAGLQQFVLAAVSDRLRWLWITFGVLLVVAGIVCFANPEKTFAGLADILGFIFLMVGITWMIGAFARREDDPTWGLGLASGILMIVVAFWTGGQFFLENAYTLLVFAGIWGLMHGISDIFRAFQVRGLRDAG